MENIKVLLKSRWSRGWQIMLGVLAIDVLMRLTVLDGVMLFLSAQLGK